LLAYENGEESMYNNQEYLTLADQEILERGSDKDNVLYCRTLSQLHTTKYMLFIMEIGTY